MNRRTFIKAVGAGTAVLAAGVPVTAQSETQRPNIVLYVTDDWGTDIAGCFGNPVVRTPGLDALAAEGLRFPRAYCTTASCSPSRSVILTGMYNHANGQYGLAHSEHHFASFPNIKSLPVLLANAGYRTLCAGKFHVEPEPAYHFAATLPVAAPQVMAERCRPFITEESDAPFFLYFCTTEPHRPFRREGAAPVDPKDVLVPPWLPDTPECREELAAYYGSIECADRGLARLIELLKETGRWDNTVVIFISDNGAPFPGAKTTLYEPGTRLPCVLRDPAPGRRGAVCNAMISWADLTPTILDYAGAVPDKPRFHGRSFRAAAAEESPTGWDEVYGSHTFHEVTMYYPMRSVRTRQHRLIWNIAHPLEYPFASDLYESATWQATLASKAEYYGRRKVDAYLHRPRFELYDLENDPDEVVNLADDPAHAGLLLELQAKLKSFQERTKDPWILKWDRE